MLHPHYQKISPLAVAAGNAAEGTITTIDASVTAGALLGAALELTVGSADTVVVRIYEGAGTGTADLLHESSIVFTATNDKAVVTLDVPFPFFDTLSFSAQATGAGRTVAVRPFVSTIQVP